MASSVTIFFHANGDDEVEFNPPTNGALKHGTVSVGNLTVFAPHDRAQAADFYRALMTAAAQGLDLVEPAVESV